MLKIGYEYCSAAAKREHTHSTYAAQADDFQATCEIKSCAPRIDNNEKRDFPLVPF